MRQRARLTRSAIKPGREECPEWYEEPLTQLDSARALLDVIGWGKTRQRVEVEVDLAEHHGALFGALRGQVLIHRDMIEEADQVDADRAEQGKPPKAEATIARAAALDRLLASAEAQAEALGIDTCPPDGEARDSYS